jgi:C-terminal processing protease CtpA/Prc
VKPTFIQRRSTPRRSLTFLAGLLATALCAAPAAAVFGATPERDAAALDADQRAGVIDALAAGLRRTYVFPDKAEAMAASLRRHQQQGDYDALTNPGAFAERLTADLQAVTRDVHLMVEYSEEVLPELQPASGQMQAEELAIMRRLNFGLERIERLPFNIGYLQLDGFAPAAAVKERFAAAMTLLADTSALIIDLRRNHGGEPDGVALLASYLFDRRTHLTDFYWRAGDRTEQVWTQEQLDGPRYGATRPLYVLISGESFSAAEGFSYALQGLERAVIVGERSGGGAHPGDPLRLTDHFSAFVPNGRSISPITGTNWEGVGVTPDVATPADAALDVAQQHALRALLAHEQDAATRERIQARVAELGSASAAR